MRALLAPALLALSLAGCRNDCQQLCVEMADYAEEECGLEWDRDAVKQCVQDHAGSTVGDAGKEACAAALPTLREEWDCGELEDYFDAAGGAAGGADTSGG